MSTNTYKLPEHICQEIRECFEDSIETRDSDGCSVSGSPTCFDVIRTLYISCKAVRDQINSNRRYLLQRRDAAELSLLHKVRRVFVKSYSSAEHPTPEYTTAVTELMTSDFSAPARTAEEIAISDKLNRLITYYDEMHSLMVITGGDPHEIGHMELIPAKYQETVTSYLAKVNI